MTTSRADFDGLLPDHRVIPVVRTIFADTESPISVYRKLAVDRPGAFLLESAEQGVWNRYSFVGVSSFGLLLEAEGRVVWRDQGLSAARLFGDDQPASLVAALRLVTERWKTAKVPGVPRMTGGLVGHLGWELVRELEHLPNRGPHEVDVPAMGMSFVAELVVVDHRTGELHLIATALNDGAEGPDALWSGAQRQLDDMQTRLAGPSSAWLATLADVPDEAVASRVEPHEFHRVVERAKRHIVDGDVFQVVLSTRFDAPFGAHPIDIYRALRVLNPSPYMFLLSLVDAAGEPYSIVGSSPEALVTVSDGRAVMHPIAGSRPRGTDGASDLALEHELLADPKERSEHVMLVDLARNDLSKVCVAGSVEVTEFEVVHRYSHIMHIVSTVEGSLRPDRNAVDAFTATFPAGTLSGAPKPRALEIIDDLEPAQRGVYGGVVGYFDFAGDADLAIAIRTVTVRDGVAHVQAGAGLVADSVPETEWQEAANKAAAPLAAVHMANRMRRVLP